MALAAEAAAADKAAAVAAAMEAAAEEKTLAVAAAWEAAAADKAAGLAVAAEREAAAVAAARARLRAAAPQRALRRIRLSQLNEFLRLGRVWSRLYFKGHC